MGEQEKEKGKIFQLSIKQMLLILGVLSIIAAGIWSYNGYRLKNITVEGLTRYTEQEFLQKLETDYIFSLTPFFCLSDAFHQNKIPFVEKYEIEFVDRHTARIQVYEKRVTGCVIVMGRYLFFDKDGIVVESSIGAIKGIPVITGLEFNEIVLYQPLNVQKQSLFDVILQITRLVEQNDIVVKEIVFDSGYEVTLHLEDVTVLLGKKTSYDEPLNALAGILKSIQGRNGTLDMRYFSRENKEIIFKEQ